MEEKPGEAVIPESLWLDGTKGRLAGVFYRADSDLKGALVVAPPFAEERKCSHRSLHRTALGLARRGFSCLRLDFFGMGDSQGAFQEADLDTWLEDLLTGADWLAERHPGTRPGVLGLRLGGTLCARALGKRRLGPCVLWQPLISGSAFLKDSLKRKRIKRMMTEGKGAGAEEEMREALSSGRAVDFDGYAVSPRMYGQLESLDLFGEALPGEADLFWVQMGPSQNVQKDSQDLADRWNQGPARVEIVAVREKPFWNLIGALDEPEAFLPTARWLEEREAERWKST